MCDGRNDDEWRGHLKRGMRSDRSRAADLSIDNALIAALGMRQMFLRPRGMLAGEVRKLVERRALLKAKQAQHRHKGDERELKAA